MRLNEVVIEYHETLNPKLWEKDNTLKDDVREALVKLAQAFIEFLEIDNSYIEDVILTGSNCNYNWNNGSDLDIHVVLSFSEFQKSCSTVDIEEMFMTKKSLWNSEHDIDIHGIPTELYVQNSEQTLPKDDALFSLGKNQWVTEPSKIEGFTVDKAAIKAIAEPISKKIKEFISSKSTDITAIKKLQDEIRNMRQKGLAKNGQFGVENLAFKELRNAGDIEKLYDYSAKLEDDDLSL
jgi:hypothetical protein